MKIKNILFIMADQLRWDYLSCYVHPHLQTKNIDGLVCGPGLKDDEWSKDTFNYVLSL